MNSTINPGFSEWAQAPVSTQCALSVVIVAWNVRDLLSGCLQSLQDDGVPNWAEVIVVDNASTDESDQMVRCEFPWVRLIESPQNLGFSRANNLAIPKALGEFVLLLNPDTVVHPGALSSLLEFAASHPEVGAVGPKLYNRDGTVQFEAAVSLPTVWNVFCDLTLLSKVFPRSRWFCGRKMGFWNHEGDQPVPGISGAAMLVPREVFRQIGLLDETMFYAEDMDLCRRIGDAGRSVFYLGSASIVHFGGASTGQSRNQGLQRQIAFQSFWLYARKNGGWLASTSVTVMVFLWSVCAVALTAPLTVSYRRDISRSTRIRQLLGLAASLFRWSIANKKQFRHYLAAPFAQAVASNGIRRRSK